MKLRLLFVALLSICTTMSWAQLETFGIIGSATPGGWDSDTDLTPNDDSTIWTIQLELTEGEVKFRPNDRWDDPLTDWGGESFPAGDLLNKEEDGDAPNIAVYPGLYDITVDLANKTYLFQVISDVAITGAATPAGWPNDDVADIDMIQITGSDSKFFTVINLTADEFKFRSFDNWDSTNWGGSWDDGTLEVGAGNFVCPQAGEYRIEIDTAELTFLAEENKRFESVGIIGDATPGGWDADTDMSQDSENPALWQDTLSLVDGVAKFRADDMWAVNWGGDDFPSGMAVSGGGDIPVIGGDYYITLDVEASMYNFREYFTHGTVGIIGIDGNFDDPVPMETTDGVNYTLRAEVGNDQLIFVGDNSPEFAYGSGDFPSGVANIGGSPIPTEAGDYLITFSSLRGIYNFEEVIEYDAVSLVGKSGPFGDWPPGEDDMGQNDFFLTKSADDFNIWTGENVSLTQYMGADDEGVKFRADTMWTINWGAEEFPQGAGTQNGANIQCNEGTYNVSFSSLSGEYVFSDPNSTTEVLLPSDINVFPNPASHTITIDISVLNAEGNGKAYIYDMHGKLLKTTNISFASNPMIDVSNLNNGNYLIQISSKLFTVGKRFSVMK